MSIPILVWHGGIAAWMDDELAAARRLPRATCERCGEPATGTEFDVIEMTQPGDVVRGYMPGRQHQWCALHAVSR